ncbi:hypothetical protein Patl1_18938 [Pistacia atlantica]|uniref:Uncharacterized protein n=1 Tax=Pistacia atlantica TaxID=434234 RepID=A0ACC1C2L0_9ROSI|nr:hypothetical protein Patl1_18938 [Pistacia atlantica]
MRCVSVCWSWYGLTQNPYFINLQLSKANNQPPKFMLQSKYKVDVKRLLLLDIEEHKIRKIPFEKMLLPAHFIFHLPALQIMCSCNGLLCIS